MAYGMDDLLKITIEEEASDLHIKAGSPPSIRIHGELMSVEDVPPLTAEDSERLIKSIMSEEQCQTFDEMQELDFAYTAYSDLYRFRVNVSQQRKSMEAVLRLIPVNIPTIDEWGLPQVLKELAMRPRGFVVVTGPTGSGKSTTLAAMIEHINVHKKCHIVTMEDPIEFVHEDDLSRISQREVGIDTKTFDNALGRVFRQDPDVILVGEMRDYKTMETAITAAETGHLVLTTLHTNNAGETVDRIIDVFPAHQQSQIRIQLASTIQAVLCQSLIPRRHGHGRVAVFEIMLANPAIRNLIREGETHQIINVIQTSANLGMQTRDQALRELYERGIIAYETAIEFATAPDELEGVLI